MNTVHKALSDYKCEIEEMVAEPTKVFAKMRFTGVHKGEFLGYKPNGNKVCWSGAALFTFNADKITDIWVLGVVKSLEHQLSAM